MHHNPSLNLVKVNAYAEFDWIALICSQDIGRKQNSDVEKKAITVLWICEKWTPYNPNLVLVKVNAYAKFDQMP